MFNSVYRKGNKYYPQVFIEECKYVVKEEKKSIKKFITDHVKIFSNDSDKENSD